MYCMYVHMCTLAFLFEESVHFEIIMIKMWKI